MERKVKKNKKESDRCRDCWTTRFREELCDSWRHDLREERPPLNDFLDFELKAREEFVQEMRAEVTDVYEEIEAIKALAGDIYMKRYKKEGEHQHLQSSSY